MRNSARAGATPGASGGSSEAKVFHAPASLITVPARSSRPSCIRTPTARWARSSRISRTSALKAICPPADSMTGAMLAAML